MDVRNLVIEIAENESAEAIQARLDMAAVDGFFLVNVVGRLAFLRTSITHKKPGSFGNQANRDGKDSEAKAVITANPDKSLRALVAALADVGIKRGKTWVSDARFAMKAETAQ